MQGKERRRSLSNDSLNEEFFSKDTEKTSSESSGIGMSQSDLHEVGVEDPHAGFENQADGDAESKPETPVAPPRTRTRSRQKIPNFLPPRSSAQTPVPSVSTNSYTTHVPDLLTDLTQESWSPDHSHASQVSQYLDPTTGLCIDRSKRHKPIRKKRQRKYEKLEEAITMEPLSVQSLSQEV